MCVCARARACVTLSLRPDRWGELGRNASLNTRYVTSMYGIFNALENGFTDSEKGFAIFAELIVGSVIYGGLAAVLSAAMMEAQQSSEEFNKNYRSLKAWMTARNVASNYQKQVLACYSHKFKDSTSFNEEALLAELPSTMASNLMEKLYGKYVSDVPYFRGLDQTVITSLAQAIKTLTAQKHTLIMEEGKVGTEMFILVHGEVMVEQQGIELGFFNRPGSFFGENPIINWDRTERRERTVRAVTDCFIIFLEQAAVMRVAQVYPELEQRLSEFQLLGQQRKDYQRTNDGVAVLGNGHSGHTNAGDGIGGENPDADREFAMRDQRSTVSRGVSSRSQNPEGGAFAHGANTAELTELIDRKFATLRRVMVQEMHDEIQVCFARLESKLLSAMQSAGRSGDLIPHGHGSEARP